MVAVGRKVVTGLYCSYRMHLSQRVILPFVTLVPVLQLGSGWIYRNDGNCMGIKRHRVARKVGAHGRYLFAPTINPQYTVVGGGQHQACGS